MLKIGCCGFPVSYKRYMTEFPVVEIQISFYRRLSERQVENWLKSAPEGFEFVLKAPQCATHPPNSPTYRRSHLSREEIRDCGFFRLTDVVKREMEIFFQHAERLKAKIILFQTPASFKPTEENLSSMESFFKFYKDTKFTFAWEPRGKNWTRERIKKVCERLGLIHATDPLLEHPQLHGDILYFRLHGDLKTYKYEFSEKEIKSILLMAKKPGYIFFNNTSMYENAKMALRLAAELIDNPL